MNTRALPARVLEAAERSRIAPAVAALTPKPVRRGAMNKTESRYALELEARKRLGEIAWWKFEAITLRLATGAKYTPDFAVKLADGSLEFHEVKNAFIREASIVRLKVAASLYPFTFRLVQYSRGGQTSKVINP